MIQYHDRAAFRFCRNYIFMTVLLTKLSAWSVYTTLCVNILGPPAFYVRLKRVSVNNTIQESLDRVPSVNIERLLQKLSVKESSTTFSITLVMIYFEISTLNI